jgi:capsular exopolysaccharide synthesis family protein
MSGRNAIIPAYSARVEGSLPTTHAVDDSVFHIIWRQRRLIGYAVGACLLIAIAYLMIAPKRYTANASIYVQKMSVIAGDKAQPQSSSEDSFLSTQCELLKSTPIVALALGMPGVDEMETFEGVRNKIAYLKKNLSVDLGRKNDLITVSLDAPSPDEAEKLVGSVVESYLAYQAKQKRSTAGEVLTILEREKDKRDAERAEKNKQIIALKQSSNTLSFDADKNNLTMTRLQSLSAALTTAHLDTLGAKSAYEESFRTIEKDPELVKQAQESSVVLSTQDEELLRAEMFSLAQRIRERQYGAAHPMSQRLRQLRASYVGALKHRWEDAQKREADLQNSFDEQQHLAMELTAKADEYQRLADDVKRLEASSDQLDRRIKEVALMANEGALNTTVVEPAAAEDGPTSPKKARTLIIALGAGLLLGIGLGLVKELVDPRLRSVDDVKLALGLPVLGMIPRMGGAQSAEAHGWAVHLDPASDVAEAYRAVRTSLQFSVPEGSGRSIVVTSASPRDGKSTLASNLAIAIAKSGKSVLVIDADFRAPSQHRIFGVSNEVGFSSVLLAGELVDRAVRRTTIERLHVMPCGPVPKNPSELLNSSVLGDVLAELCEKYDHVVIDSPPVMAVDDARIVAASCDLTVLVVRAERSNRKLAGAARDALLAVGARICGIVLNDSRTANRPAYTSYMREKIGMPGNGASMHSDEMELAPRSARPLAGSGEII